MYFIWGSGVMGGKGGIFGAVSVFGFWVSWGLLRGERGVGRWGRVVEW